MKDTLEQKNMVLETRERFKKRVEIQKQGAEKKKEKGLEEKWKEKRAEERKGLEAVREVEKREKKSYGQTSLKLRVQKLKITMFGHSSRTRSQKKNLYLKKRSTSTNSSKNIETTICLKKSTFFCAIWGSRITSLMSWYKIFFNINSSALRRSMQELSLQISVLHQNQKTQIQHQRSNQNPLERQKNEEMRYHTCSILSAWLFLYSIQIWATESLKKYVKHL
ncbi:hypothetical protein DFH28DRAFT_395605 [Melampsora americana]|nr:hypothetical protein DFH28DRAFT_395605 [Melampsora americana]